MRAVTHCGTLWTLQRDAHTLVAELRDIEGIGLELRYVCVGRVTLWIRLPDGADLLREAAIKRFEMEAR